VLQRAPPCHHGIIWWNQTVDRSENEPPLEAKI